MSSPAAATATIAEGAGTAEHPPQVTLPEEGFSLTRDRSTDVSEKKRYQQRVAEAHEKLQRRKVGEAGKLGDIEQDAFMDKLTTALGGAFGASDGQLKDMKKEMAKMFGERGPEGIKDYVKDIRGQLSMVSKMKRTKGDKKVHVKQSMVRTLDTLAEQLDNLGPDGDLSPEAMEALENLGAEHEDFVPSDWLKEWRLPEDLKMATGLLPNKAAYYNLQGKMESIASQQAQLKALGGKSTKKALAKRKKMTKAVERMQAEVDVIRASMDGKWRAAAFSFHMKRLEALAEVQRKRDEEARAAGKEVEEEEEFTL